MPNESEIVIIIRADGTNANSELQKVQNNVQKTNKEIQNVNTTSNKAAVGGVSQMNTAIGALGWTLGDANMFMVNFRMGMMSVANNIPMIVQGFLQAKSAAEATGTSLKTALIASLTGPGGVMLAINALMFALQVLPQAFGGVTESAEEQKEKIKELTDEYNKLTKAQLTNKETQILLKMGDVKGNSLDQLFSGMLTGLTLTPTLYTGGMQKQVNTYLQQLKVIQDVKRDLGGMQEIENEINRLEEQRLKMNQNPDSKYYFKNIEKDAKNFDDALLRINKRIKANNEELDKFQGKNDKLGNKKSIQKQVETLDWGITKKTDIKEYEENMKKANSKIAIAFSNQARLTQKTIDKMRENSLKAYWDKQKQEYWALNDLSMSIADGFRSAFSNALQEILGEANSVFEIIAQNFLNRMLSVLSQLAAESIFQSLFGFLFPTGGGILKAGAALLGVDSSGASLGRSSPINITVVNTYDSQVMNKYTVKNINGDTISAQQRRL